MNQKYEYRYENTVSTKVAVIALQEGWRAVYCDAGDLDVDEASYFMAVIHTKAFRRPRAQPTARWELCPPSVYRTQEYWGVARYEDDTQTLEPLVDAVNFVKMLAPGEEISDEDRVTHLAQHHADAAHETAPEDQPS